MRRGAFKVQAIPGLQAVVPPIVQPDFKLTAQDMQKFFAFVSVGLATASTGLDAEKMRFHGGVAPGEELHADVRTRFEDLALGWTDERLRIAVSRFLARSPKFDPRDR